MQLLTLRGQKIEESEAYFFDIVTAQYDHPRYVKHVLGHIPVFSRLFGYWVHGVVSQGIAIFHPRQQSKISKIIFLIPRSPKNLDHVLIYGLALFVVCVCVCVVCMHVCLGTLQFLHLSLWACSAS